MTNFEKELDKIRIYKFVDGKYDEIFMVPAEVKARILSLHQAEINKAKIEENESLIGLTILYSRTNTLIRKLEDRILALKQLKGKS